jgi:hypothetical protein
LHINFSFHFSPPDWRHLRELFEVEPKAILYYDYKFLFAKVSFVFSSSSRIAWLSSGERDDHQPNIVRNVLFFAKYAAMGLMMINLFVNSDANRRVKNFYNDSNGIGNLHIFFESNHHTFVIKLIQKKNSFSLFWLKKKNCP